MRFWKWAFLAALLAARGQASSLTFTLDSPYAVGQPGNSPVEVFFSGNLIDNDTANTCDGDFVDCLYLNSVSFSFDQDTATSHLSGDLDSFIETGVPGSLSDDGPDMFNFYIGNIFGIYIAPNTPSGVYTGSVSILGGYDDPAANSVLASTPFSLVVAPEPADFGLATSGLGILLLIRVLLIRRRVSA